MKLHSYQCLLILFLFACSFFLFQPSHSCLDHERSALLHFKSSFIINCKVASHSLTAYPKVQSWGAEPHHGDCCYWNGVHCDEKTSHVIELDLSSSCLYGTFPDNSTLFTLRHLQLLSLSDNHFNLSQIPVDMGQLSKLVSLDLYNSAFDGQIPLAISKLSMLTVLDLSKGYVPKADNQLRLEDPGFEKLVQNLTLLRRLSLVLVDISSHVPNTLTNFTHLETVMLEFCNLIGQFPTDIFHLPHIETLSLTANIDLVGFLPKFQHNNPLKYLDLQSTSFHGELPPSIGELANLEILLLNDCHFTGPIPPSLGNLTKLTSLDLYGRENALGGDLPSSLTNLTQLQELGLSNLHNSPNSLISWLSHLNDLATLKLNNVNLGGSIPSVIGNFTSLEVLVLQENQLKGRIPNWLTNLTQLHRLSLYDNDLEGPIFSPGISQLSNLEILCLGGNHNLHGNFDAFLRFKNLTNLKLNFVNLTFLNKNVNATDGLVAKLRILDISSCNFSEFPQFLQSQDKLIELRLGSNQIKGLIPQWFVDSTQDSLSLLDLSGNNLVGFERPMVVLPWSHLNTLNFQGNQLYGSLPIPPRSIIDYRMSDNHFVGRIPIEICQASSMLYFDVSHNNLSGEIPRCISKLSSSLHGLNLAGNKFHGIIPRTYSKSCSLKMINLSGNQLKGSMPRSLANCINLEVLDVGNNYVNDTFPSWLGGLPTFHILVLRHNNFHGKIGRPKGGRDFCSLHIIDLSNNFLNGELPAAYLKKWDAMKPNNKGQAITSGTINRFFTRYSMWIVLGKDEYDYKITITIKGNDQRVEKFLTVFKVVDFSSNNFTGKIPNFIGELLGLQALNLSNNKLQGKIPSSLANMEALESLDLANNMLSGNIPQELTRLTYLEVFNVSHNLLTGSIPQGTQFSTFDNSSFAGNLGLCGGQLSKKCGNTSEQLQAPFGAEINDETKEDSMFIDWIIRCLGCIGGFMVGCAFGKYLTDRNHEWFVECFGRRKKREATTRRRATMP